MIGSPASGPALEVDVSMGFNPWMGARLRLVCSFVRVIALLAIVEASGIANIASDVLVAAGVVAAHDDCDDDEQGGECPPGCPMCHCFHCGMTSVPLARRSEPIEPEHRELLPRPNDATALPAPALPSVYRPPRTLLAA